MDKKPFNANEIRFGLFKTRLKQLRKCDTDFVNGLFSKIGSCIPTDGDILSEINCVVSDVGRGGFLKDYDVYVNPEGLKKKWHGFWSRLWESYGGRPFYLCTEYWMTMASMILVSGAKIDILLKAKILFVCLAAYLAGRAIYKFGRSKVESGLTTSEFHLSVAFVVWVFLNSGAIGDLWTSIFYASSASVYAIVRDITKRRSKQATLLVR